MASAADAETLETTASMVERQAAEVVLPYLRAFDLWRRHTDPHNPEETALRASRAALLAAAGGEQAPALHTCLEEIKPRLQQLAVDDDGPGGGARGAAPAAGAVHVHREWAAVLACLCGVHHQKVLGKRRQRSAEGCAGGPFGMARGVKYRLYALRNAPELRPLRSYWIAAVVGGSGNGGEGQQEEEEGEQPVEDSWWDALEGASAAAGARAGAPPRGNENGTQTETERPRDRERDRENGTQATPPPTGVMHQQHGGLLQRRWSLYVPESYAWRGGEAAVQQDGASPTSTPLVLALHGAKTSCEEQLLTWLPVARANRECVRARGEGRRGGGSERGRTRARGRAPAI